MAIDTIQHELSPVTSDWSGALARFREIEAEYDRRIALEEAAGEAAHAMVPRVDEYFDVYRLGIGMERGMAHRFVHSKLWMDAFGDRGMVLWPKEERESQEAKSAQIQAEADRITDDFMAYQTRSKAAREECRVDEAGKYVAEMRDPFFEARAALISVPAPDGAALLLKLELSFQSGTGEQQESALEDARRLLVAA